MKHKSKEKWLGILGGMGPEATAVLLQKIIALTPATKDQDHLPMVIYHNPKVPDRTAALVGDGASPLPMIIEGLRALEKMGADVIIIPCNTAFYYYEQMQQASRLPIVHLIEEVVNYTRKLKPGLVRVGLLATTGTVKTNLYQERLARAGIEVIVPEMWEQGDVMAVIQRIKAGEKVPQVIKGFAEGLIARGAQALILGCTELSLVSTNLTLGIPIIDSLEVLARVAVDVAMGKREPYNVSR